MFEFRIINNGNSSVHNLNDFFLYKETNGIYEEYDNKKYYAIKCTGNFYECKVKYTYV